MRLNVQSEIDIKFVEQLKDKDNVLDCEIKMTLRNLKILILKSVIKEVEDLYRTQVSLYSLDMKIGELKNKLMKLKFERK